MDIWLEKKRKGASLANRSPHFTAKLALPADAFALEKAQAAVCADSLNEVSYSVENSLIFFSHPYIELGRAPRGGGEIHTLNYLTHILKDKDNQVIEAVEDLAKIHMPKNTPGTLLAVAKGMDSMHKIPNITDDHLYGEYLLRENLLSPALAALPEEDRKLLDPKALGRRQREKEGGIYLGDHYIFPDKPFPEQSIDSQRYQEYLGPLYAYEVDVNCDEAPFGITLRLPGSTEELEQKLLELGKDGTEGCTFYIKEALCTSHNQSDSLPIGELEGYNRTAAALVALTPQQRQVMRALTEALGARMPEEILVLCETIDQYELRDADIPPHQYAVNILRECGAPTPELLDGNTDLNTHGEALMAQQGAIVTDCGPVVRRDGRPLRQDDGQEQSGITGMAL